MFGQSAVHQFRNEIRYSEENKTNNKKSIEPTNQPTTTTNTYKKDTIHRNVSMSESAATELLMTYKCTE